MIIKHGAGNDFEYNVELAWAMSGFVPHVEHTFVAAAILTGRDTIPLEQIRRALWEHEDDLQAAALAAFGLEPTPGNRRALATVMELKQLNKADRERNVQAGHKDAEEAAEQIQRAFLQGSVQHVTLNGKHSKGTLVAKDSVTEDVFLLKPGSGTPSPASGVTEEPASQTERECAFWAIVEEIGIGDFFPRADSIIVDGHPCAALRLLPFNYKGLDTIEKSDPNKPLHILDKYTKNGIVHKWSLIDFVLGNPDRHAGNIMASDDGGVVLIDHGSAFAGKSFDPGHDKNSFVPYYLRCWAKARNYNKLTVDEKLSKMPTASDEVRKILEAWCEQIQDHQLVRIMEEYNINPEPMMVRLQQVKGMLRAMPLDIALNQLWIAT